MSIYYLTGKREKAILLLSVPKTRRIKFLPVNLACDPSERAVPPRNVHKARRVDSAVLYLQSTEPDIRSTKKGIGRQTSHVGITLRTGDELRGRIPADLFGFFRRRTFGYTDDLGPAVDIVADLILVKFAQRTLPKIERLKNLTAIAIRRGR